MRPDLRAVAVAVAGLCTFLNLYAPQAILPALAGSFAVPLARTAWSVTAPLLAVAAVAPFAGAVSDRLGRKRLIVGACAALAVPTLLVADARSLPALLVWRFAQGLLLPFIFAVTVAYVGDECEGSAGIRTAGSYSIGAILGGFLGRFIAGIAADLGGWRAAFVLLAVLTSLGAAFVAWALPRERRFRKLAGGWQATLTTYAEHLTNPRLLATCAVGFGMLFTTVATFTYVNFYLAQPPFGLSPAALGFVFTVYLLGIVTTSLATRLAIRVGRRGTLALAVALAIGGLLLTMLRHTAWVIAGLAVAAGGLFVIQALSLGFIGAAVRRGTSTAVGLYVTVYYAGGALGGIAPAWLWHAAGWPGVVALLVVVLGVVGGIGAGFWTDRAAASRNA